MYALSSTTLLENEKSNYGKVSRIKATQMKTRTLKTRTTSQNNGKQDKQKNKQK